MLNDPTTVLNDMTMMFCDIGSIVVYIAPWRRYVLYGASDLVRDHVVTVGRGIV